MSRSHVTNLSLPSLAYARLIVQTEFRRKRRALSERSGWQLAILVFSGLFFLLPIAAVTVGAYALSEGLRTGSVEVPLNLLLCESYDAVATLP